MNKKEIIILLIQQDLVLNQLTEGLRNIGLDDAGVYSLNISPIIAKLMDVPEEKQNDKWNDIYMSFLNDANNLKANHFGKELLPIAEKCYDRLRECA